MVVGTVITARRAAIGGLNAHASVFYNSPMAVVLFGAFSIHHLAFTITHTHTHIYSQYISNIYEILFEIYIYICVCIRNICIYFCIYVYVCMHIYTYTVCVQLSRFGCRAPSPIAQSRIFAVYKKFEIPNIFIHIFHFSGQNKYFLA